MRPLFTIFSLAALVTTAQADSLVKHTFESDTGGWLTMGTNGSVAITHDKPSVKAGAGALEYKYSLDGKGINTAVLPLGAGTVAAMGHIQFWIKSDHDTAVGVVLSEKKPGGGAYTALIWTPANAWQHIDLVPADFTLNDGPNDPVDSDGKLDTAQVEAFGIIDVAQLFNHLPADAPIVVARSSGSHTILLDDFEITGSAPPAPAAAASNVVIDRFDRGFSQWITLGGMTPSLTSSTENPIAGPTLAASIQTAEGKLALLIRRVDGARLEGTKRIAFDIAADHEGTFVLSIEVKKSGAPSGQGPRYTFLIYPPEGRKVFRVNVSLADFEADANSPEDPAGKLEAGHIKSISIGDISAMAGGTAGPNKIWIGPVEMVR